jgi:cell division protein FtsI/penicillin-binding protein 2
MILSKYHNRVICVFMLFCALYFVLLANLYKLQIKQHDTYATMAKQQYSFTVNQFPARASIFDRNGVHLALNKDSSVAFILPDRVADTEKLALFLQEHFPESYVRWQNKKEAKFMFIARRLTPKQIEIMHSAHLKDIHMVNEPSRYYPHAACAAVVGMTDVDNKGILGIEQSQDQLLKGLSATYQVERDARSGHFYFSKIDVDSGNRGESIYLTVDSTLQFLVHQELEKAVKKSHAQEGAVIVMNPDNGDILTMTCFPHFDPNSSKFLDLLTTKNLAISHSYEFGSVNKIFVALAALQEGVVTSDELIDCKNAKTTFIEGRKINTWHADGFLTFKEVIAKSNNIGIAIIAKRLQEKLYEHYLQLGFGRRTKIGLPAEQKGFVNHPANWSKQSIISLSYGYEIASTLLQIAQSFCLIAHDGCTVQPRINLRDPVVIGPKLYDDAVLAAVKEILEETTLHGTAHRAHIKGYRILSKTGSSHVLENGVYSDQNNIYSCSGIIERDGYKRVITLYLRKEGDHQKNIFASTVAAPFFESVAQRVLMHDHILT